MLCSRLLYLWEAPTVRRVVLWKRGRRWWWWRVWQCSLHPGPRQERPWTEGGRGTHSAPKLWRVTHPLISTAGCLWALMGFSPRQWHSTKLHFLFSSITEVQAGLMLRSSHESQTPSCWSRITAQHGLLNLPNWKSCSQQLKACSVLCQLTYVIWNDNYRFTFKLFVTKDTCRDAYQSFCMFLPFYYKSHTVCITSLLSIFQSMS